MVESRRQSGRLAQRPSQPLTKQNTGDTDSGDDSDGYESLLTELSDSDDDFGDRLRQPSSSLSRKLMLRTSTYLQERAIVNLLSVLRPARVS